VREENFKRLNDTHGHQAGDECLRQTSGALADMIRGSGDVVSRYGGEEFALLLPSTEAPGAAIVAGRMRLLIERLSIESGGPQPVVTASFGVASSFPRWRWSRRHSSPTPTAPSMSPNAPAATACASTTPRRKRAG
jgi:diguanylate cyclase (GGDEF)-like protein